MSVAQALVDAVQQGAAGAADGADGPERVLEVHVRIGPLAGIATAALSFAFEVAARGTLAEGADLVVQRELVVVRCSACGATTSYETLAFDCGTCGALSSNVTADDGLELVRLVLGDPCG
jgi:hydrogenase nickel incorporation protein HypA/HybF